MPRIKYIAEGITPNGAYSHAVESNGLIYFSGQTPIDPTTGKLVTGTIRDQTKQSFKNLFSVLKSTGLTCEDVIKVNVYLTDMKNLKEMNEIYEDQFEEPYPARTTIGVKELPREALIEIEMIAIRKKEKI